MESHRHCHFESLRFLWTIIIGEIYKGNFITQLGRRSYIRKDSSLFLFSFTKRNCMVGINVLGRISILLEVAVANKIRSLVSGYLRAMLGPIQYFLALQEIQTSNPDNLLQRTFLPIEPVRYEACRTEIKDGSE